MDARTNAPKNNKETEKDAAEALVADEDNRLKVSISLGMYLTEQSTSKTVKCDEPDVNFVQRQRARFARDFTNHLNKRFDIPIDDQDYGIGTILPADPPCLCPRSFQSAVNLSHFSANKSC